MQHVKFLLLIFLVGQCVFLAGQSTRVNVGSRIINVVNEEPITYVHVYIKGLDQGTVSNLNGEFFLRNVNGVDTLVFSFIGFDTWETPAKDVLELEVIKLYPATEVLNEVTLVNNDDFLYNLLAGCKKSQSGTLKTAKTYFSLNTFVDSSQVELLECYYNGNFRGYDLENLNLKNGRISLKPHNENYFVSVSTSRALVEHRLFEKSTYFPLSPFELNKKSIVKEFFVHQESKFKDDMVLTMLFT